MPGHATRARLEHDAIVAELTRPAVRHGRPKRLGDDTEKACKTVTAHIHRTLHDLDNHHPAPRRPPARRPPYRHDLQLRA